MSMSLWWDGLKDKAERVGNFVTGGMNDRKKSEKIMRWAKEQEEEAQARLETARQNTSAALEEIGTLRAHVYETTVKEFVCLYERLNVAKLSELNDVDGGVNLDPALSDIRQLKQVSEHVQQMMIGGGAGALGGASLALGAWGLAGMVGTASTGTAISTLTGVAASNATLAWLGGGAASAGGLGVAGGMAVLGGIALIPTAVLAMYFGQNSAKQKLNEARNYQDEVDAIEAEINTFIAQLEQICKGADLMKDVIRAMDRVVQQQNQKMREKLDMTERILQLARSYLSTPLIASKEGVSSQTLGDLHRSIEALESATV